MPSSLMDLITVSNRASIAIYASKVLFLSVKERSTR